MSFDLFDRVRLAREGSAVERCHTAPHRERYSVGHHSLDLVTLITLCWLEDHAGMSPSANLLIAAAFHDIPERAVGDVPQPVKALLDGKLDEAEDTVLLNLGLCPAQEMCTEEELRYLHEGDKVELYLWCIEQLRGGDHSFMSWVEAYNEHFLRSPALPSYAKLMKKATSTAMERLKFSEIKEFAGL